MIAQYVERSHKNWDERIPEFNSPLTRCHRVYASIPKPRTRTAVAWEREQHTTNHRASIRHHPPSPQESVRTCTNKLGQGLLEAAKILRLEYYDEGRRNRKAAIQYIKKSIRCRGNKNATFNAKLAPKFEGPFEIQRMVSSVIFDLRDRSGRWHLHVHKRFKDSE